MDKSSADKNRLIEQYVTGLMTEEEALEFEVFILSKPDWQKKVNQASALFEEVYEQQWTNESELLLAQQAQKMAGDKAVKRKTRFDWQFNLMPSLLAMGFGVFMAVVFMPQQQMQLLGKTQRVSIETTRSAGNGDNAPVHLFINKGVDHLVLKLPVSDNLSWTYAIKVSTNAEQYSRGGYKADEHGNLTFSMARKFNHDELMTVGILKEVDSAVVREYQFIIKEN